MSKEIFRFILLVLCFCCSYISCIKVCEDYKGYVEPNSPKCHDNMYGDKNLTEILNSWPGVTAEEIYIYTDDGYKILIVRAVKEPKGNKHPVVLGHGIFTTPLAWVNRGTKSLVHFLLISGHEVFIVNFRSSPYSREHTNCTDKDEAYWKFSIYQPAVYDLADTLNLVLEKSNKKSVYIGHGLGSTAGYIYSILKSEDAESTLQGMISLGPVAYLNDIKSILRMQLPILEYLRPVIFQRLHGELPLHWGPNCSSLFDIYLQQILDVPAFGDDFAEIDPSYLPLIQTQNKAKSVGIDVLVHLAQILRSKKFQCFDFGQEGNMQKYGTPTPELLDISKIPVPVVLFVGINDWFATKQNAKHFYTELKPAIQCGFNVIQCEKWNHKDFIEAKDIEVLLYDPLFKSIDHISAGKCS